MSNVIFGPLASQILADYGADVIKIEPPGGDSTRHTGPAKEPGMAGSFIGSNRSKRSIVLDLKRPEAQSALHAVIGTADVFMHNIRPQKLARIGIGRSELMGRNPRLVYAFLSGFGEGGPYAGLPAYDDVIQGMSGAAALVEKYTGEMRYFPTVAADKTSALTAAHAILAGLFNRERTGSGCYVEIPMFESMVAYNLVEHLQGMHFVPPISDAGYARVLAPWRKPYRTTDGYISMMPYTDDNWRAFFMAVGAPELADDPRFRSIAERTRHIRELLEIASTYIAHGDTAYWLELCRKLQIPAAPVAALEQLPADPHLVATGFFETLEDPVLGKLLFPGVAVKFNGERAGISMPPRLGEHTCEVLFEAGLSESDVNVLLATGAACGHSTAAGVRP